MKKIIYLKTIQIKMFFLFAAFMILVVLCGIILNILFLEKFYIYTNKSIFIEARDKITNEIIFNKQNVSNLIDVIDRVEGINCTITDRNLNIMYNSFPIKPTANDISSSEISSPNSEPPTNEFGKPIDNVGSVEGENSPRKLQQQNTTRLPKEIEKVLQENDIRLANEDVYTIVEKPDEQLTSIVFVSRLKNEELIILKKSIKGILESVAISNKFYIFSGLVIIILGGTLIYIFSARITRPIIEMSNVAEGISELDFTNRVVYNSQDELGRLGKSINKIAEKLSTSIDELKKDVKCKKQLVSNISHELKTPIGIMKGYAEGLKFGIIQDKEKITRYCSVIVQECDRMDRMVQELLNVSMLESGTMHLKISEIDLLQLLQNIVDRFESVFQEKGITLTLNCEKNLTILADSELLEWAINNYVTNAIHYADGAKYIHLTAEKNQTYAKISVFNTGIQIPEHELENIWDVFYKVDKSRTRKNKGHGLGLSIVKLITELHHGNVGVKNLDDGVMFYLEIPQKNMI